MGSTGFFGSRITQTYYFPQPGEVNEGPFIFTVSHGVEDSGGYLGDYYLVDFTDNQIKIDYYTEQDWNISSFNGPGWADTDNSVPDIVSVALSTNMDGLDPSDISFTTNDIRINWQGLAWTTNTFVTLTVTFADANAAPTAAATGNVITNEDTASAAVAIGATDADGDALTYSVKNGSGPAKGAVSFSQANGTFTYMPNANQNGSDSFTILISDGEGGATEQVVSVTVNAVADLSAADDIASTDEDTALNGSLGDTTTSGGTLSYAKASDPSNGTVTVSASGSYTYTPASNYHGEDSFTYTVTDAASGESATKKVTITVNSVNDEPIASDDSNAVVEDTTETAIGNVLTDGSADSDVDGDVLSVTTTGTFQGKFGVLTLSSTGAYTYVANGDLIDTLTADEKDVFSYSISDGKGGTDQATLTIDVELRGDNITTRTGSGSQTINGDQVPTEKGTDDTIFAGSGNDTAFGLDGADNLYGESGDDKLYGGNGWDDLFGGDGKDTLEGGAGMDVIDGGSGNDRMTGGSEADTFIFKTGNGYDTITDFVVGVDKLVIEGITVRSIVSRDVDGDSDLDLVVTFGSGGGNVTLLDAGSRGTITQEQLTNPQPDPVPSFSADFLVA